MTSKRIFGAGVAETRVSVVEVGRHDRDELDYADQRYYASIYGRFNSPDPFQASAGPNDPVSWNRYSFTGGDPINRYYTRRLDWCAMPGEGSLTEGCCPPGLPFAVSDGPDSCYSDPCDDPDFLGACEPGGDGTPAGAGSPPPPQPPDCIDPLNSAEVAFVNTNYLAAVELGAQAGIPNDWILAWSALESYWGTKGIVTKNANYIGWRGAGNVPCPKGANPGLRCFTGFAASLSTALFSANNYFPYGGLVNNVPAGAILFDQYSSGASVSQAFNALATAGYTPDNGYGGGVASRDVHIINIQNCLRQDGILK